MSVHGPFNAGRIKAIQAVYVGHDRLTLQGRAFVEIRLLNWGEGSRA
ncbi:hypothetical protein [Novispirillum itersonii]|nr:hypothetical protein [Novispirillum itersonii]